MSIVEHPGYIEFVKPSPGELEEIARRKHVERRLEQLLELGNQLAAAQSRDEVVRLLLDEGKAAIDAVGVAVWLTDGDQLRVIGRSEAFGAVPLQYDLVALANDMPLSDCVRTGVPIYLGSPAAYRERYPQSFERVAATLPYPEFAFALLPLVAGSVIGGICFTYDRARTFGASEQAFKGVVARQAALALERIAARDHERKLREAAESARRESDLLYRLTAALQRADALETMFDAALGTVEEGAHCDRSAILLFDHDGVMQFRADHGLSATYRAAVTGHSPWTRETTDPPPVVVDNAQEDPAWAAYRELFAAEGIGALAFVPLVVQHRLIGKFMLYRDVALPFTTADVQFASTVAAHVAIAVDQATTAATLARAFDEERVARLQADEAIRAREEILSVVSHDLRSPLGAILMTSSSLLQLDLDRTRARTAASRIHRQAERMTRLIEDLVDFAAIQTGRVTLARAHHAPAKILDAAVDMFAPLAEERGLRFETSAPPDLPQLSCDSERAVQVMSNLVSNALKVTPPGGAIAIGAKRVDARADEVVFFVRDTGPGISSDDLPRLFERFWRGKQSAYRGAGLGLSIARGIVDAHGGRIWAESTPGMGSTFYFSLGHSAN